MKVAIKIIKKTTLRSDGFQLDKVMRETEILRKLRHPNVIKLIEVIETETRIHIVLEYCGGGELFDLLINKKVLSEKEARKLFRQMAAGLGHCHLKGVYHRDLKLENLYVIVLIYGLF